MSEVFIIIPTFNHQECLAQVVLSVKPFGRVVVVNDGSAVPIVLPDKEIIILNHLFNRGQGAALQTGMDYVRKHGGELVVHFDADGQHQASDIPKLLAPLKNNQADIVFGSRFLDQSQSQVPLIKKWLILKPNVWLQNIFLGIKLTDVHNGLRAMNRVALNNIKFKQDRMAHATEIVQQVKEFGLRYCEVPVCIKYSEFGQGLVGGLKIFRDLFIKKFNR